MAYPSYAPIRRQRRRRWLLAILAMAGIREKLKPDRIPAGLQGPGITLILAGLMALAFIGFAGVLQGR